MGSGILLEAGINEMELLIFRLDNTTFGINVAKVREIIQRPETIAIPHSPEAVEGSFTLRDKVLTLVNLGHYFEMQGEETQKGEGLIIIVEFNDICCGVLVDGVEMIHRLHWDQIEPPSPYLMNLKAPVTGSVKVDEKTVLIADFETILAEILGIQLASPSEDGEDSGPDEAKVHARENIRILFADDSATLRSAVKRVLTKGGFTNLAVATDGQQAWDTIVQKKAEVGEGKNPFDLILTDIEMPRMDGLHLTSKIKQDPELRVIPVVLFSSLITEDNRRKGEAVGADAQVSKPDSDEMLHAVEECLAKSGVMIEG